ncbi:FtsX-like permease family protein [Phycicoccus sp. Soil803]|uniref:FtsX-like permease family protein n=1 Tax=Phycicoccus sp. Soil803 TaxID=1736415 RepID=UPI00071555E0|nr:FtsX-like permease family protein [Phycicoccus sp. Soil803]KRF23454.1 hypothetical protein ASG95_01780 [Phycicoccus sp. Soil803]
MTTLMEPKAPAGLPEDADRGDVKSSRLSRWRASWRVALRMARRDVRRHKGRSILVFLMVAIPVGLLAGAATLGATEQADAGDLITARMGPGQALVQGPQAGKIQQTPDPNQGGTGWSDDNPAATIPGFSADAAAPDNAAAIGRLVGGGPAVAVGETQMRLVVGERRVRVSGLVVDPRVADLGDKARLSSGSWGNGPDEIVITPAGERKGLPRSGSVTLSAGGTERSVQVVGTASALLEWGGMPDFVVPSMPDGAGAESAGIGASGSWVLVGGGPVTWEDVQRLNTYGLTVYSRAVLEDPPPESALPPELRPQDSFTQDTGRMIAVIGGVMLFILTTLLVGPAFAVSATRQRRTLALAATNGAETRQLRRTVLAQALVLGVISALGGVVLGTLAVRAGLWWWVSTHPESSFASIALDIPWGAFAILVPCAVLSAVVAALLPSLRLGRLDIIGVMRGQSVSPRLNKVVPVVGLVLALVGGAVVLSAAQQQAGGDFRVAVGAVGLVLGTLLLVPAILVAFGALAARFPVAPRIAIRDAARHRSRSTPTVAAILAGVVALTAFSIGLASDTKQQMATYQPQALPGEGTIYTGDTETQLAVGAALGKVGGAVRSTPLLLVRGPEDPYGPSAADTQRPQPFVTGVPQGCTVQNTLDHSATEGACGALGTLSYDNGQIGVLPAREIKARLRLTVAQGRVIDEGGIAVGVPALAKVPTLTVAHGTFVIDQSTYSPTNVVTTATAKLPVVAVAPTGRTGAMPAQTGAFVTPETAKRLGWPTFQTMVLLHAPDGGAIDEATEKQLDELVGDEGGLYVERGFQRYDEKVMKIMMAVAALLLLIVTLISTALSMAEQQADSGTLAAVGATRRTRRAFAAAQAMVVGFIGAVLGIAVGLVPGIAITYPLTRSYEYDSVTGVDHVTGPYLAIPWTPLLLVVLGVPLLAGALSALAIRRAPAMTRRAD